MARDVAKAGDLLAIPIGPNWAMARVLFVSNHFKDIMLLAVSPKRIDSLDGVRYSGADDSEEKLIYTGARGFSRRGWRRIGSFPVTEGDFSKTLRISAGNVWLGDEFLRPAEPGDQAQLPVMYVDGHIRVERMVESFVHS
jgi:hypothetical protein